MDRMLNQNTIDPALRNEVGQSDSSHELHQPLTLGANQYEPSTPLQHSVVTSYPPPPAAPAPQNDQHLSPYTPQSLAQEHHTPTNGFPDQVIDGGKRPRACEACRGLKVRCEFEGSNPDSACKRCTKANRQCVITQPSRKRQKKTDSRVAELEKKIDALTATLHATQTVPSSPQRVGEGTTAYAKPYMQTASLPQNAEQRGPMFHGHHDTTPMLGHEWTNTPLNEARDVMTSTHKRKYSETKHAPSIPHVSSSSKPASTQSHFNSDEELDVIDRNMLTVQMAESVFSRYTEKMCFLFPAVVFPHGTTMAEVRQNKPTLFLAILTAASGAVYPDLQTQLNKELMQVIANRTIVNGEKNLELVQALLVSSIWYWPPEHFEQLKFYQLVHMAAIMAIDLNMNRKIKRKIGNHVVASLWREDPRRKLPFSDPDTIEARRAWLACYILAANSAMGLRRQNLIRWSPYLDECLDLLDSTEAASTDSSLCQWVRSQHIAEEVGNSFSMDDSFAVVAISDPKVQYALKGFERDLEKWSEQVPEKCQSPVLKMAEHVLSLYMHEVAMHVDHNVEEFKPPFTEESLRGLDRDAATVPLTAVHINALSTCLTAIDGVFTTFLSIDIDTVRALPVMHFVRMAYAVVVLLKMYFAAAIEGSELGKVIDKDNMRVEFYLDHLLEHLRAAAADEKSKAGSKFLVVVAMLKNWFSRQRAATLGVEGSHGQAVAVESALDKSAAYNGSNTPLQLLSEIATSSKQTQPTSHLSYNQQVQQGSQSIPWSHSSYLYNPSTTQNAYPALSHVSSNNTHNHNIDPNLSQQSLNPMPTSMDAFDPTITNFEQAMGMTMEGTFDARFFADDAFFGAVMDSVRSGGEYWGGLTYP